MSTDDLQAWARKLVASDSEWSYSQTQNPAYVKWAVAVVTVALLVCLGIVLGFIPQPATLRWPLVVLMGLGVLFSGACYGGLHVAADRRQLRARLGVWRIPLLRVRWDDLAEATVEEFSPLRDFGGYGIRYGKRMWAFFFRGGRGVVLSKKSGKRYLIGSDDPDALLAVIRAAAALAA